MSLSAPTQFAITGGTNFNGGSALNLAVSWQSAAPLTSTVTVNSNAYTFQALFDNPSAFLKDLTTAASCSVTIAEFVLAYLQLLARIYANPNAVDLCAIPFNVVIS